MQQVILAGLGSNLTTGATSYIYPYGHVSGSDATVTNRTVLVPEAGTISKLRVLLDGAPGAAKSYTFTLYVNGSASALTCAVSGAVDTSAEDITNSVSVSAGDALSLQCVPAGTPTARGFRVGYVMTPTAATTAVLMGGLVNAPHATITLYTVLGSCEAGWDSPETNRAAVWNIDATIKTLYIELATAPGAGKSRAFAIMKNGSAEASSTVTISDAATTGSVTGLSIDLAPGDKLSLRTIPTGTPTATATVHWGMSYSPDTDGQYCYTGYDQNSISNADRYNSFTQYPIGWSNTSEDRTVKAGGPAGYEVICKSIRVALSAAPGVGTSRTFALTVAGTPSALSVSVADAATTGVTTTDVSPTIDQLLGIKHSVSGAPASAAASVSMLLQSNITAGGGSGGSLLLLGVGS